VTFIIVLTIMYISLALHEFGHYIVSKIFNLKVRECSVGTGPSILKFSFKETKIYFRIVPIGGYVGTDEEELNKVNLVQYWIIVLSGVLMNYIVAVISLYIQTYRGISYSFKILVTLLKNLLSTTSLNIYHLEGNMKNFIDSVNTVVIGLSIWEILFCVNGLLLIVNLIPIPFLDGGEILIITFKRILLTIRESKIRINKTS
jgi:regulator of sigma E protease